MARPSALVDNPIRLPVYQYELKPGFKKYLKNKYNMSDYKISVVESVLNGETTEVIASKEFITESTIKNRLTDIYKFFLVSSRSQLQALLYPHCNYQLVIEGNNFEKLEEESTDLILPSGKS